MLNSPQTTEWDLRLSAHLAEKLTREKCELKLEKVDLNAVALAATRNLEFAIHAVQAKVEVEPLPTVSGDAESLLHLFSQLLLNALIYRREPTKIVIGAKEVPGGCFCFIEDNGPGIPLEDFKEIFKPFYRVPNTMGESAGKGLGLTYCSKIVQMHQGRIWVNSNLGRGTTVWIALPQLETEQPRFHDGFGFDLSNQSRFSGLANL